MPGYQFIRFLRENKAFEKFLDTHEQMWMAHERAVAASKETGIEGPGRAVPRPAITRDDLGGAQAIAKLRKSVRPEAELNAMIASAQKSGDNGLATRLSDFAGEFDM